MLKNSQESISEILGIKEKHLDLLGNHDKSKVKCYDSFRSSKDNMGYPSVISLAFVDSDDFFANIATYYDSFIPVTNMFHVVNNYTFNLIKNLSKRKQIDSKNIDFILNVLIGLMVGESYLIKENIRNKYDISSYSYARNSFSFFVARSYYLYDNTLHSDILRFTWGKFSEIFNKEYSEAIVETVIFIKELLTRDFSKKPFMDLSLTDNLYLFSKKPVQENKNEVIKSFIKLYPTIETLASEINGPYNDRMNVFNKITSLIGQRSKNFRLDEVVIAFFCNEISPGSYSHYNILKELEYKYPAVLIWYGFFSSLSNVDPDQRPNLFIKLKRDIVTPFSFEDRPICDISIDEFEVLSRINNNSSSFNLMNIQVMNVALVPGININVNINKKDFDHSNLILNEKALKLLKEATLLLEAGRKDLKNNR